MGERRKTRSRLATLDWKGWGEALRPFLAPLGWSLVSGLVGAAIGLLAVTLWIGSHGALRP